MCKLEKASMKLQGIQDIGAIVTNIFKFFNSSANLDLIGHLTNGIHWTVQILANTTTTYATKCCYNGTIDNTNSTSTKVNDGSQ